MPDRLPTCLRLVFGPPSYDDKVRSARASANFIIGWGILLIGAPAVVLVGILAPQATGLFLQAAFWLAVVAALLMLLTIWRHETAADVVAIILGWLLYVYLCYNEGGLIGAAVLGFLVLVLVGAYVRGPVWGVVTTLLAVLSVFLLAHFEALGVLPTALYESNPWLKAGEYMTYFLSLGVLQAMLSNNARRVQQVANREALERRLAERRLADAIEHAPYSTLVCELTADGNDLIVVGANSTVSAAGNVQGTRLIGRLLTEVYPGLARSHQKPQIIAAASGGEAFDIERVAFSGLRGERFLDIHVAHLGPGSVALFARDVTEHHEESRTMLRDALHDELTGLTNRTLFLRVVSMALANRGRRSDSVALLFLDVDNFKSVNDVYGHVAGDHLLKAVAERLPAAVRGGDVIARLGGDEFVVLLTDVEGPEDVAAVAARVKEVFADNFKVGKADVSLTVSIGATLASASDSDAEALLRRADHAMYQVKRAGRDGYQCFDERASGGATS